MWSPSFSSSRGPGVGLHLTVKLEYAAPLGGYTGALHRVAHWLVYILVHTLVHTRTHTGAHTSGAPLGALHAVPSGAGRCHYLTHGISWVVRRGMQAHMQVDTTNASRAYIAFWLRRHLSADTPAHGIQLLLLLFLRTHASREESGTHQLWAGTRSIILSTTFWNESNHVRLPGEWVALTSPGPESGLLTDIAGWQLDRQPDTFMKLVWIMLHTLEGGIPHITMLCSIRWQQDVYLRQISSPVSPFLKYEEWKVQEARTALSSEVHVWSTLVERGFPKTSTFTKLYSPNPSVEQAQWAHIYIRKPVSIHLWVPCYQTFIKWKSQMWKCDPKEICLTTERLKYVSQWAYYPADWLQDCFTILTSELICKRLLQNTYCK